MSGPTSPRVPEHLLAAAARLLPTSPLDSAGLARGQFHDVVLLPRVAAVRVARDPRSAEAMPRRTTLLHRLAAALPFAVPTPLTEVTAVEAPSGPTTAVAHTWLGGRAHPPRHGDPVALRALLAAVAAVATDPLADVLDAPHAYAGGARWEHLVTHEVLPRVPRRRRGEAARRLEAVAALPEVPAHLVHSDLAGHNVHWDGDALLGVLDWDLASAWDPAVDVACLAGWHGWEVVGAAVDDGRVLGRARAWQGLFALEQVASAIHHGESEDVVARYVERAVAALTPARVP